MQPIQSVEMQMVKEVRHLRHTRRFCDARVSEDKDDDNKGSKHFWQIHRLGSASNSPADRYNKLPVSILCVVTNSWVQYKHARVEDVVEILKMKATTIQ